MPVTFRGTSTDAIHGFVVGTTNANTMLIPAFVATFTTTFPRPGEQLMPCHEYCGTGHEAMWARVQVLPAASSCRRPNGGRGSAVFLARKLVLAHFWVAFVAFLGAIVLGAWQMYVRSPLQRLDQQSRALLPLGHRARHRDGVRAADARRDGLRLRDHASSRSSSR